MIIVIDGPSGSGKSTLAKRLAKELHIDFFDTGAMYRSFCWYLLQESISVEDKEKVERALKSFHYEMHCEKDEGHFFVNDQEVTTLIRDPKIDKNVSIVSSYLQVRQHMVRYQQSYASSHEAVYEGRDMGTVVFPNADVKFFLVADVKVRAQRRYNQLKTLNSQTEITVKEIEEDLIKRDEFDSGRKYSPLKQANDAILIDATSLSIEEVFQKMKSYIMEVKHGS